MDKGQLIAFSVGEKYSIEKLKKFLLDEAAIEEAVRNEYFVKVDEDKYIFTKKGRDFAWS